MEAIEDIYTADLTGWVGSRADRYAYCDEATEEYGERVKSVLGVLQLGMARERLEVFAQLMEALTARAEAGSSSGEALIGSDGPSRG